MYKMMLANSNRYYDQMAKLQAHQPLPKYKIPSDDCVTPVVQDFELINPGYISKYSPYQNVKADVKYPPVLFVTATSDDRVTPVHARKMAAKMEAQGHDVLFYENTDGGHAAAANHKQAAEMWALSFVYLKQKLGL